MFPMKLGDDRDPFVILGNIPELSAVFETKARAPFKIVFEVCRLSELIEETLAEEKGAAATDVAPEQSEEEKKELSEEEKEESLGSETGNVKAAEGPAAATMNEVPDLFANTMRTEEDHIDQDDNPFGLDDINDHGPGDLKKFENVPLEE